MGWRIGILTFHRCINYGSYWQARCLVEGLRGMGADAVLLDHRSDAVERAEMRCAFRPILPAHTPRQDFPAYAKKVRAFDDALATLPLSAPFPLDRPDEIGRYDRIVVGSDEVWNLDHPWYGGCPLFYGEGIDAPLVAYAASFGNHDAKGGLDPAWARRLDRFAALSVRDENSRRIVGAATGREPDMVLDPCLQFPVMAGKGDVPSHGDVILYGHNFPAWLSDHVGGWAKRTGHRIVSIGYRNDWADAQRLSAGPQEFAERIAGARAVVTNFFHGCIFAILHGRPLVAAPTAYRRNKIEGLMQKLGIPERIVDAGSGGVAIDGLLDRPVDARERLKPLRARSEAYVRRALDLPS